MVTFLPRLISRRRFSFSARLPTSSAPQLPRDWRPHPHRPPSCPEQRPPCSHPKEPALLMASQVRIIYSTRQVSSHPFQPHPSSHLAPLGIRRKNLLPLTAEPGRTLSPFLPHVGLSPPRLWCSSDLALSGVRLMPCAPSSLPWDAPTGGGHLVRSFILGCASRTRL